jgi:DNA-binding MarR family transcriptional regulator
MCVITHKYRRLSLGKALSQRLHQAQFENCEQEAVLNLFVSVSYIRQRLNTLLGKYGITMTQYNVLRILRGVHPEGHPRCEIMARMLEPSPDATRLIDRLVRARLVERAGARGDRRMSVARITTKGLRLLEEIGPLVAKEQNEVLKHLSESECRELSDLCEKIYS